MSCRSNENLLPAGLSYDDKLLPSAFLAGAGWSEAPRRQAAAFYTRDDFQTIPTCWCTSCIDTACLPVNVAFARVSIQYPLKAPSNTDRQEFIT